MTRVLIGFLFISSVLTGVLGFPNQNQNQNKKTIPSVSTIEGGLTYDSLSNPSVMRDLYLSYSKGAAEWLMSIAKPDAGGYVWGEHYSSGKMYSICPDWIDGTAGIGNYFLDIFKQTGNQVYMDYAKGAAQWLIANATPGYGGYCWLNPYGWHNYTGIYSGAAGIGLFLLNAYKVTANVTYLNYATGAAQWLNALKFDNGTYSWPEHEQANDNNENDTGYAYGAPGIGEFFLDLFECTGNRTYLDIGIGSAAFMICVAIPAAGGFKWRVHPFDSAYSSQNIGASGIGNFFLHLYQMTSNQTYMLYAEGAGIWLNSLKNVVGDKYRWVYSDGGGYYYMSESEGAAGICTFLLSLFQATGNLTYLSLAEGGARWLLSMTRKEGTNYSWPRYLSSTQYYTGKSYGTAGVGTFFLKIYEATGNSTYLQYVKGAARWLTSTANDSTIGYQWSADYQPDPDDWHYTGLHSGAAGIGGFFLACALAHWDNASVEYSRSAAQYLVNSAQLQNGGYFWYTYNGSSTRYSSYFEGTAGIGTTFLDLFHRTANNTYLDYSKGAAQYLISIADPNEGGYRWQMDIDQSDYNYTGLGNGVAGIGKMFLEIFLSTGNQTYLDYAKGAAQWLKAIKTNIDSNYSWPTIHNSPVNPYPESNYRDGAAGIGDFMLDMFLATSNETYLDLACGAARWIQSQAISTTGGLCWPHLFNYGINETGFDFGASGIGTFLYRLYMVTGNQTYFDTANAAFSWVIAVAASEGGGYYWHQCVPWNTNGPCNYTGIQQGVAGIAQSFLDAFALTGNLTYLNYAKGASQWLIWSATQQNGRIVWPAVRGDNTFYIGVGSGVAGITNLFLNMYEKTGNLTYLNYARKTTHWILDRAVIGNASLCWSEREGTNNYYSSLRTGTAGIALLLSRAIELDFEPPSILTAGYSNSTANQQIHVSAEVTDNYEVATVLISWTKDNGITWQNLTLNQIAPKSWEGQIPGQPAGTTIMFKVYAKDSMGYWQVIDWETLKYTIPSPEESFPDWVLWILIIAIIAVILIVALISVRARRQPEKELGKARFTSHAAKTREPETVFGSATGQVVKQLPEITVLPIIEEGEAKEATSGVYTYRGGRIVGPKFVYKVKIKNATDTNITDVVINLMSYPRDCMQLTTEETRRVAKIEPGGFRSLEFELQPMKDCVEGSLVSSVVYMDAKNEPHPLTVAPFTLKSVCDLMEPLEMSEKDFDALVTKWPKTGETISFKGEDVRALITDVPAIFESKNFQPVVQHVKEDASEIIGEAKGIAIGKYTKRKLALTVQVRGTVTGSRSDGEITCVGYAEDSSMLAACLSEVLDEFRKPLIRSLRKVLKENKNAMDVTRLQAILKVDAHVLADAVRQQDELVFLHGGETVASYDFIADFINNMRKDYSTIPVGELEAELRPIGKSMRTIIQDLLTAGKVRAFWVGADEIQFKVERHKVAFKMLYYAIAIGSGVVTILVFLWNFFK